jgi:biotin synthase
MKLAEIQRIYEQPLFTLIQQARNVYLEHWKVDQVQLCTLLSIKTGGCSEDCGYCSQSSKHDSSVKAGKLLEKDEIMGKAREAAANGSTRFCMGAAWRGIHDQDPRFPKILDVIRDVGHLGMEVCVTLGHLTVTEANKLKEAGLTAYNHNIDTSPEYYPKIVTTHSFQDRLNTIRAVQEAGLSVCCGGIVGMGESETDRLKMLEVLSTFDTPPESVPINCLVPMSGTPLENQPCLDVFELLRLVAATRIVFPKAKVRLSAGRSSLSREAQAFCFYAGANSIFYGDRLLTSDNPGVDEDRKLLADLNLSAQPPHQGMAIVG